MRLEVLAFSVATFLAMREPLIQHEVYEYSGDADIHPQWPCPARDRAMAIVAPSQPATQGDDHHRHNHDGERDVWNQNHEINHMPQALPQEANVANLPMKIYVACQKQRRRYDGGDHAGAVRGNFPAHNQAAAQEQQHRAGSVQSCDKGRKVGILFRDHAAGLVVRRFAIKNARANITSENRSSVAMADGRGKVALMPG